MNLGNKIRELRLQNSATQEQLAKRLSVSTQCVSKWENNVTMPDIQLLPELSAYFGVTIDELFSLSGDVRRERISNMLRKVRELDGEEFRRAEKFLRDQLSGRPRRGSDFTLLAELYLHMADSIRSKAEECAVEALALDPESKETHSLLRAAQQGALLDWNLTNRHRRIAFYQRFMEDHPNYARGYVWLLDDLIADNRLDEAEAALDRMAEREESARIPLYRGRIQWGRGDHAQALETWRGMAESFPRDWLAHSCLADCLAGICEYGEAVKHYRLAMELQQKPRYTDSAVCIAHIYEIQGEYGAAIEAWQEVLGILREEYGLSEGEDIDAPMREIARLKKRFPFL